MKKLLKVLMFFAIIIVLTGCVKINYELKVVDEKNASYNMMMLYSKNILDTAQISREELKKQITEECEIGDWELKDVNKKVDGEDYFGFQATAPKSFSDNILKNLTVRDGQYTLKMKSTDFGMAGDPKQFEESGYSVEELEEMGMSVNIKITMPGKIKSSTLGEIKGNVVTLKFKDITKMSDGIVIVSEESSTSLSGNKGLIIGTVMVIVVLGGGAFLLRKKKSNTSSEDGVEN